mgnify:CR=1 FL=1
MVKLSCGCYTNILRGAVMKLALRIGNYKLFDWLHKDVKIGGPFCAS